jgi:hypothetical protein
MGGKAALLVVFGLTFIFSAYQLNTGNVSTRAADNLYRYYSNRIAHQIAVSGLNIAAAKLYEDNTWRGPMANIPFRRGDFSLTFTNITDTLMVACNGDYQGVKDTVVAYFSLSNPYTKYTFFTFQENGVSWTAGDTAWGPIHTNATLNHQNKSSIVFYGKVTAGKGISSPPKNAKTKFLGGYEVGVFVPQVTSMVDLINAAIAGGYNFPTPADSMKIQFNNDGTLDIYQNSALILDDITFSALAPNGAIYSAGPIELFGTGGIDTPTGGVSIGSGDNVVLRNPIGYADDPLSNPSSDDLLAVVSLNNIVLDNKNITNWNVQCVLMAINGSLLATNMSKNGAFNYLGSVYQDVRGNAKMFQSFQKNYRHDLRLNTLTPPFFPGASDLHLLAWWE